MKMTITEALAEIKTLGKRVEKKHRFVMGYLYRQERFKDPLEKEGGSVAAVRAERQAISDLQSRIVAIRMAIAAANEATSVTIGKQTRTIAEWLVWRREVAPEAEAQITAMQKHIQRVRQEAMSKGVSAVNASELARPDDVIININEQQLANEAEALEEILGALDGQLSLKNATVTVDV